MRIPSLYIYGFFDSQGKIETETTDVGRKLIVKVELDRIDLLEAFKSEVGGRVLVIPNTDAAYNAERKLFRYQLYNYRAAAFLRESFEYLFVKRERAAEALGWWESRERVRRVLPQAYYDEARAAGREPRLMFLETKAQQQAELKYREEWLASKGLL